MSNSRNSSIELLRLLAIFGIVVMHVNGSVLNGGNGGLCLNSVWLQLENSIFNCGVTIFILISGYYGIRRNSGKILVLEGSALFYSLVGVILAFLKNGGGSCNLSKHYCPFLRMNIGFLPAI